MYLAILAVLASGCTLVFPLGDPPDAAAPSDGPGVDGDPPPPPDAVPVTCPETYNLSIQTSSTRYRQTDAQTFSDAAADCLNDRGASTGFTHLIVLDGDAERQDLATNLLAVSVWVGLTRVASPQAFVPVTTQPTGNYPPASGPPWIPNEPTDSDRCAVLDPNSGLIGADCGTAIATFCECDAFPPL